MFKVYLFLLGSVFNRFVLKRPVIIAIASQSYMRYVSGHTTQAS